MRPLVLLAAALLLPIGGRFAAGALTPQGCTGDPITPTEVVTGTFVSSLQGAYVMVPFTVPTGVTQVRIRYCWDQPEGPTTANASHTIDLGLWEARPLGGTWGTKQFRGWGGSSHPDVSVTPQGFSSEAEYLARPKGHVPGRTTRGFVPGPIPAGEWAAELGVAGVVAQADGDADGQVRWRVEIELSHDPAFAADPYRPAHYDRRPVRRTAGWYAGDMHVHAEHSALGNATMTEVFDYAFRPLAQGGAGLDFLMLSDYVVPTAWGEIGRYQASFPDKLIARSAEVITYRGHTNNHTSVEYVDHRTGPVYERASNGDLTLLRPARPASAIFRDVRAAGGFTQINHPTIFPSSNPIFRLLCRGCSWDYSSEETDFSLVDAIEIQTGPAAFGTAPNPFTVDAIAFWEAALASGHHIAAVGSSDSHKAGRADDATETPVGQATTMIYARRLSEGAIRRAVQQGHTYVKLLGNAGPDIRFEAHGLQGRRRAIMGDRIHGFVQFTAQVLGVQPTDPPHTLRIVKDGVTVRTEPVTDAGYTLQFPSSGPGRYRLQLQRGNVIVAVGTPIWVLP